MVEGYWGSNGDISKGAIHKGGQSLKARGLVAANFTTSQCHNSLGANYCENNGFFSRSAIMAHREAIVVPLGPRAGALSTRLCSSRFSSGARACSIFCIANAREWMIGHRRPSRISFAIKKEKSGGARCTVVCAMTHARDSSSGRRGNAWSFDLWRY